MAAPWTAMLAVLLAVAGAEVSITDNGYSGLVVGISQELEPAQAPEIIDAIKMMFTEGSPALYTATEHRAFFKDITIVLPMTWSNVSVDGVSYTATYENAEVRVAPENPVYGNNPYTLQPAGCGQPGRYIHLTPGYLSALNTTSTYTYGPPGKVLTHEWAHLRYGVFEEYGYAGDAQYPMFYYRRQANGETELVPNVCTDVSVRGYKTDAIYGGDCTYDDATGLPDGNCYFYPYDDQKAISSLMSFTYLQSVEHFCNSTASRRHQTDAPTKHNARCQHQSVWDVIAANADFAGNQNPPKERPSSQLVPHFQVVRPAQAHFILVLDTSGSMQPDIDKKTDRIGQLHAAATKWIKYELQEGTAVAIVNFTDTGELLTDFLVISDDRSRERIANFVPSMANGGTCICNGIDLGLKTLAKKIGKGGVMVLMTDGNENQSGCKKPDGHGTWNLTQLYGPVQESQVRVITMAFGKGADSRLERFAEISGGRTYFIRDRSPALDLDQAFQGCLTYQPDITVQTEKTVTLFQQHFASSAIKSFTGQFSIDPSVGREFVFKLECSTDNDKADVAQVMLVAPSGTNFTNFTWKSDDDRFGTIGLEQPEEGDWLFRVTFRKSSRDVVITVTSKSSGSEVVPLTAECWVANTASTLHVTADTRLAVLARVRQADNAVLRATVMAHVSTPGDSGAVVDMQLRDGGVGADQLADDGIYSRFFTQFSDAGRYAVVCEVKNDGAAVINEGFAGSGSPQNPRHDTSHWCCGSSAPIGNTKPTGNFSRTASAGAFQTSGTVRPDDLPPSEVNDLTVQMQDRSGRRVNVTWTAPGADLDDGTAALYEFKWSVNASDLSPAGFPSGAGEPVNGSLVPAPLESGQRQSLALDLGIANATTVYIAMRTRDQKKHWSGVSNVATVFLGALPAPPTHDGLSAGAIAGIVVAVVVVVAVIAGSAVYTRQRRKVDYRLRQK